MVRYQGEKMSKSLGNLVMVRDLLQGGWPADAIRLYMAGYHYREEWTYDEDDLAASAALTRKLRDAVTVESGRGASLDPEQIGVTFQAAMDNDLDTPAALTALVGLADEILSAAGAGQNVGQAQESLRAWCAIFGLRLDRQSLEETVIAGWQKHRERCV